MLVKVCTISVKVNIRPPLIAQKLKYDYIFRSYLENRDEDVPNPNITEFPTFGQTDSFSCGVFVLMVFTYYCLLFTFQVSKVVLVIQIANRNIIRT